MDGGRVLKAHLWRRYGDPVRASVGAARAGRILAFILIALGLVQFLAGGLVSTPEACGGRGLWGRTL